MTFPKKPRNWKRVQARSLRDAFRLCKDHARERRNLSVERIAELLDTSPDALYKWLSNASMPSGKVQAYEHICGIHLVTEYLAASGSRVVIQIPAGRPADAMDINRLQAAIADAIGKLIRFYHGESAQADTEAALSEILKDLAWHRENVHKAEQPELALGDGE